MALIKCPECGKEISDKAPACPSCGACSLPGAWYYADRNGQVGPLTLQELKEALTTFQNPDASDVFIWREGFPDWKPAKDVVELNGQTPLPPPLLGSITQQARDEHPMSALEDLDSLGKNLGMIFMTGKGAIVARLSDDRAIAIHGSRFQLYPSIRDYVVANDDYAH